MEKNITTAQIKCVNAMLAKLHLTAQRVPLISGASAGRTESLRELTAYEATALIRYLKSQDPEEQRAEVMRKKIISMCHDMRWHTAESKDLPRAHRRVDMKRLDAWMIKSSYLHKALNQYRYAELPKLVTQFENVFESFLKGL